MKWRRYIPEGTRDILFEEYTRKIEIENILRRHYLKCGFLGIESPTLEFYDVFNGESSTLSQEEMYKLFDNQGRIMVLRPDMTTAIARISATKLKDAPHPLKLCYTSNVFRVHESLNGKKSEITQSGIEIIGIKSLKADAEVIIMAIEALIKCGLKNFKIELSQAELFKAVIAEIELDDEDNERLKKYIENKNSNALYEFLESRKTSIDKNSIDMLKELPRLFGDIKILDKAQGLTNNTKILDAIDSIRKVYEIIKESGFEQYISVDLGMVQHLEYYTGIIFKGYALGVGGNMLSGGRYDNLIKQFGVDMPATGFALDVDLIIDILGNKKLESSNEKVLIHYNNENFREAYLKAEELRESGSIVELSLLDSIEEAIKYAKEKGIEKVIEI